MIDEKIRARVLEVDDDKVVLGVYLKGAWHRIKARTRVPLEPMSWIQGHLTIPPDGSMVLLEVTARDVAPEDERPASGPRSGLDLEA